ncbi:hypothetical protein FGO68_gene8810 [Halteria grandinella]|uniref:Uncharacterized protein n=1 Tax=Halteria grandinella TaxID=5974 RepID=A0A8J8SYP0_HALGN|nr:hypothetical protein FGO68_gene8810 [Halteria grandinella]
MLISTAQTVLVIFSLWNSQAQGISFQGVAPSQIAMAQRESFGIPAQTGSLFSALQAHQSYAQLSSHALKAEDEEEIALTPMPLKQINLSQVGAKGTKKTNKSSTCHTFTKSSTHKKCASSLD